MDENMHIESDPSSDEETCNDYHYSNKLLYIDDIKAERSDSEHTDEENDLENDRLYEPAAKKMRSENEKGHRTGGRNYKSRNSQQNMCTCIPSPDQSIESNKRSSNKSQGKKRKKRKGEVTSEDETQVDKDQVTQDSPFRNEDEDESLNSLCHESDATPDTQTRIPNAITTATATTSTVATPTTSIAAATTNNAAPLNGARCPAGNDGEFVQKYTTDEDFTKELRVEIGGLLARNQKLSQKRPAAKRKDGEEGSVNDQDFIWRPMNTWIGKKHVYQKRKASGLDRKYDVAYDAFRAIWDDKILSHIVATTNLYATTIKKSSLKEDWYDTNIDEILILLCFWMMLGVVRMPSIKSCFCDIPILRTEVFRNLLTENRYWNLNRAFCMTSEAPTSNLLHRMGPVLDHLNVKFQSLYMLKRDIRIDESSTIWQVPADALSQFDVKGGRLYIKIYHLRDCASGYLWSFSMYAGRSTHDVDTVSKLLKPRLNLGHVLYMKDLYHWPSLARFLKRNGTNLVSTVSQSAYLPLTLRSGALAHGEMVARHDGDVMVVALQEYNTRRTFISTYHDLSQAGNERGARQIHLVRDYESKMSVVDPFDHPLEPYISEKKEFKKWSKELFKQFLNFSIQNACVLAGKSAMTELNSFAIRLSLVQQIVDRHHSKIPSRKLERNAFGVPIFPVTRLTERHFIRRIPTVVITKIQIEPVKRYCVWCAKNGRTSQTVYECPQCALPLCLENCFEQLHTTP